MTTYPLIPKTTAALRPGQFWSIPMSDGRFGCGRVVAVDTGGRSGGRTRFIGAVLDWVGDSPPSSDAIAGSQALAVGNAHVRVISLLSLDLKLGGTRDIGLLPRIGELRYLELWMIRGLTDITAVGRVPSLRALFLQALRQVETLPDLSGATSLRRIRLETMKGLRDLQPLTTAPALEEVELIDMRHLQPEDLAPLAGLPKLKAVTPGLGSRRKNDAATLLLGLPPVSGPFDWRQPEPTA